MEDQKIVDAIKEHFTKSHKIENETKEATAEAKLHNYIFKYPQTGNVQNYERVLKSNPLRGGIDPIEEFIKPDNVPASEELLQEDVKSFEKFVPYDSLTLDMLYGNSSTENAEMYGTKGDLHHTDNSLTRFGQTVRDNLNNPPVYTSTQNFDDTPVAKYLGIPQNTEAAVTTSTTSITIDSGNSLTETIPKRQARGVGKTLWTQRPVAIPKKESQSLAMVQREFMDEINFKAYVKKQNGLIVSIEDVARWVGTTTVRDLLTKAIEDIKPLPLHTEEELIINFNDLADALVVTDLKRKYGEFLPEEQTEEYKISLEFYSDLISSHKRKSNE